MSCPKRKNNEYLIERDRTEIDSSYCVSYCVCLLFRETEPDWDQEIATDVTEECSKYGPVSHTHVDKNSKVKNRPFPVCV